MAAAKQYDYDILKTTVPREIKERFEEKAKAMGYRNKSDYLRKLVERDLEHDDFLEKLAGLVQGVCSDEEFMKRLAGDVADRIEIKGRKG